MTACRQSCATLPAYAAVRAVALREARRNEVQGVNHGPSAVREPALHAWAAGLRADSATGDARWFELAAAGSSSLAVLALIAAAADSATTPAMAERVRRASTSRGSRRSARCSTASPTASMTCAPASCNFVSRYASQAAAVARLRQVTMRAVAGARSLPRGERHVVLVAGMIAMHVSEAGAWLPWTAPVTRAVLRAADTMAMPVLLALLRTWRRARERRQADSPAGAAPIPTGQLTPVPPSPQ